MAIEDFEMLIARAQDPRRAYKVRDMPAEDAQMFLAALDRQILDEDRG